jgi:hypothetical protein
LKSESEDGRKVMFGSVSANTHMNLAHKGMNDEVRYAAGDAFRG